MEEYTRMNIETHETQEETQEETQHDDGMQQETQQENIDKFIINFCNNERVNIQIERSSLRNISKALRGVGDFGEELTTYLFPESFGSASKGGCAFDNIELDHSSPRKIKMAREVKTCCQIQPKKCNKCDNKSPYYQSQCVFCDGCDFTFIRDTRFGINCKSHFLYRDMLKEYIMIIVDYDNATENITIKIYKINSSNEYFTSYLRNQLDNSKSTTCNLLPYSYDFYCCGPILLLDYFIDIDGNITHKLFNLVNETPSDFDTSTLNSSEKEKLGVCQCLVAYADIAHNLKVRTKCLGKARGTTTRL